jgi:hypothetical protein
MPNVMDYYLPCSAVDSVNNPVVSNTNPIKTFAAFELDGLTGKRVYGKSINLSENAHNGRFWNCP